MKRTACLVASWILCTASWVPAASSQGIEPGGGVSEKAVRAETSSETRYARPEVGTFSGKLVEMDRDRLMFEERRELRVAPDLVRRLGDATGRVFEVAAAERRLPGGIVSAASLTDAGGLYAISESIRDVPLLAPDDRAGIRIEQLLSDTRTLVYDSECETVYNVPVAFFVDKERYVLQPAENREITLGGRTYVLSLEASHFVVAKSCPTVFEGAQSQIDYNLLRK